MTPNHLTSQELTEIFTAPELYPHPVEGVEHLATHISHVFLAGDYAYKLKRPVDLGFLDFSTLERRIRFCREELRLNLRLAPEIYLQVMALVRRGQGHTLEPLDQVAEDEVIEPCLQMARMDEDRMMDRLLDEGRVSQDQVRDLARLLADFYQEAEGGPRVAFFGRAAQVRVNVEENFRQTEAHQGRTVSPARWRAVRDYSLGFLGDHADLFAARAGEGRVRDGHGDLHSGNINLPPEGRPIVFDCIEFNDRFRLQDTACDLAFLAMDLDFHQRDDLRRALVEEYVVASGDRGLGQVLSFYQCYRAVVRAKIHGFTAEAEGSDAAHRFTDLDRAKAYFRLAAQYAGGEPPYFLVVCLGLMGTGKTYLAEHLAQDLGCPHFNSDAVRKELAGIGAGERDYAAWGEGIYGPQATRATYQALLERGRAHLAMGAGVILDASFSQEKWRHAARDLAQATGARALFIEVRAEAAVVAERLRRREEAGGCVSDGRRELMAAQAAAWEGPGREETAAWLVVDGGAPLEAKLAVVRGRLEEMGRVAG